MAFAFAIGMFAQIGTSEARSFKVLHSFSAGQDGAYPEAGLILDSSGNLYGTTSSGGPCNYGTVFKIAPDGTETVLYTFTCGRIGLQPDDTLVMDVKGNLYGATIAGGNGCGVVFEVRPDGTEKTIRDFAVSPDDACGVSGPLILGHNNNLYGTASGGGKYLLGVVFKLSPYGTDKLLVSFRQGRKGNIPESGLIMDGSGNLYGTTGLGGRKVSAGVVFELPKGGAEEVLYSFKGPPNDGSGPSGGLLMDNEGDLYGTLISGGKPGCESDEGCGAVYRLSSGGSESVLHFFTEKHGDGGNPYGGVIADGAGNLYGTTQFGGRNSAGTVFEIAPDGTETVLHNFNGTTDGANPISGLVGDSSGNLYGTAAFGGTYGYGTVFEITP
jgi:uncharacterized repeat protein (TIGR03803 family)